MPYRVLRLEDACMRCIEENIDSFSIIPSWVPEDLVMFLFRSLMRKNKITAISMPLFLKTSLNQLDLSILSLMEYKKHWKTFSKFSNFVIDKDCTLSAINFKSNDFLEQLYVQHPPLLSEINLQFCRKLTHCFVVSSSIVSLNFQSNDNLQEILLDCPKVTTLQGLAGSFKLTSLTLKSDVLSSLDLTNKYNLKSLSIESKSITKIIDFQNCVELRSISLETNEGDANVTIQRPLLEYLRIANEKIETLEIKGCFQLVHLELECPNLKSIEVSNSFRSAPPNINISRCHALNKVVLKSCKIVPPEFVLQYQDIVSVIAQ